MSTAEQIAVPAFIREGKCQTRTLQPVVIHTCDGPDPAFPIVGSVKRNNHGWTACNWRPDGSRDKAQEFDYDLVPVAEERPREWEVLEQHGLIMGFVGTAEAVAKQNEALERWGFKKIRLVELPEGWEVRRKEGSHE